MHQRSARRPHLLQLLSSHFPLLTGSFPLPEDLSGVSPIYGHAAGDVKDLAVSRCAPCWSKAGGPSLGNRLVFPCQRYTASWMVAFSLALLQVAGGHADPVARACQELTAATTSADLITALRVIFLFPTTLCYLCCVLCVNRELCWRAWKREQARVPAGSRSRCSDCFGLLYLKYSPCRAFLLVVDSTCVGLSWRAMTHLLTVALSWLRAPPRRTRWIMQGTPHGQARSQKTMVGHCAVRDEICCKVSCVAVLF